MKLILARHGNTFEKGARSYYVGAGEDLPLTAQGEAQAAACALTIRSLGIVPAEIRCGPLRRAARFAAIIADRLGVPAPAIDARLQELDYGAWSGRTRDEVVTQFGERVVSDWEQSGKRPKEGGWSPPEYLIRFEIASLLDELRNREAPVLLVSSNGRLRSFAAFIENLPPDRPWTMKTGNLSLLDHSEKTSLVFWDRTPD